MLESSQLKQLNVAVAHLSEPYIQQLVPQQQQIGPPGDSRPPFWFRNIQDMIHFPEKSDNVSTWTFKQDTVPIKSELRPHAQDSFKPRSK